MEALDLVIVGAGWHGIAIGKTYHQANPAATIRILDSGHSVGGCWAAERIYPGLRTNNLFGSYEFSDLPMTPEVSGSQPGQHIPGMGVHKYLCAAVRYFGIEDFLQLQTQVHSALLNEDNMWELICSSNNSDPTSTIRAKRLVIATGLTSEPYMPSFVGQSVFRGLIMHARELTARSADLGRATNVVVVGGNKSAWDVAYSVARAGGTAHMVIRPSGGGPSWTWPSTFSLFGRTSISKLSMIRALTLFDPWPFAAQRGWQSTVRTFLHRWTLGIWITSLFWSILGSHIQRLNGYARNLKTSKLVPWSSIYWMGNSLSVLNYPTDWSEFVRRDKIVVHHADVVSLDEHDVLLSNGRISGADAIVCSTGWKASPSLRFLPENIECEVGLPGSPPALGIKTVQDVTRQILHQRPFLSSPPRTLPPGSVGTPPGRPDGPSTSYQLYRYLVPSSERFLASRNLAFIGVDFSLHTLVLAQAQALWITAFFEGKISHLQPSRMNHKKIQHDTILLSEYERLRRPALAGGSGAKFGDFVFDSLPYVDMLLEDLQMSTKRKRTTFEELFTPHGLKDYTGLVQEWMAQRTPS